MVAAVASTAVAIALSPAPNESRLATLLFDLLTEEEHINDQATGHFRFNTL
jgi:hypothetical protein